ncbi:hypothetical protein BC833DRAFT_594249 [Globomyces pollinis-pini]|nr:hypothetical protein BC833DRAFT_594249 [Globomyces pollinis-pini]
MRYIHQVILFISLSPIQAYSVLQVQYQNTLECNSSPTTMYLFDVDDLFTMEQPANEKWPEFYTFTVEESPIGYCGSLSTTLVYDCCVSTLDLSKSFGIASGSAVVVPENDFNYSVNHYAAGGSYCILQQSGSNLVNGYRAVYILNDNNCYDQYQCYTDGTVRVFAESNCQGEYLNISLSREPLSLVIGMNQNITGRFLKGNKQKIQISWITYMPTYMAIPSRDKLWDKLQFVCIYTSIFGDFVILFYPIYLYFKLRKCFLLLTTTNCFVWLLVNSISGYYALAVLPDNTTQYYVIEVMFLLQNIATLLTVTQTTLSTFKVMMPRPSASFKYLTWISILVLHFVLAGSYYFGYCWNPAGKHFIPYESYLTWLRFMPFWYLFVFLYDILPPILIVCQLIPIYKLSFRVTFSIDLIFTWSIITQIIICIFFFTINYVSSNMDILGDDLSFASVKTLSCTLVTIHSQLHMFILSRLRIVLKKLSMMQSKTLTNK